jgi:polyphosphate kinase 2 (PPK2 family)
MGFCAPQDVERFLQLTPAVEEAMVNYRIHDRRKTWRLSDLDLQSCSRW